MSQIRLIVVISVMMSAVFGFSMALHAQIPEVTPEAEAIRSLFSGDTCEPPCWFGLIPGESSEEEILAFLNDYASAISVRPTRKLFDSETGDLISIHYSFSWHDYSYFNPPRVNLTLQNGVLDHIWANPNREITFGEMFDVLGYPDQLYLGTVGWSLLTAIYENPRVRILLDSRSPSSSCKIHDIAREFRIMEIEYFSMEAAQELVTPAFSPNDAEPEPSLLLPGKNNYLVSKEQFEEWLNDQGDATCSEIWHQLRAENEKPLNWWPRSINKPDASALRSISRLPRFTSCSNSAYSACVMVPCELRSIKVCICSCTVSGICSAAIVHSASSDNWRSAVNSACSSGGNAVG